MNEQPHDATVKETLNYITVQISGSLVPLVKLEFYVVQMLGTVSSLQLITETNEGRLGVCAKGPPLEVFVAGKLVVVENRLSL